MHHLVHLNQICHSSVHLSDMMIMIVILIVRIMFLLLLCLVHSSDLRILLFLDFLVNLCTFTGLVTVHYRLW